MPTSAPSDHLLPWEGGRMPTHRLLIQMAFDTRMPLPSIRHFERKREIFFVRGKAKDVRGTASGKHRTPCAPKTVFHADRSTQEKEHGKRKRYLGCARDDDTRMPLRTHSSFRAKVRNLFRSRQGKGCERNGKRETPYSLRPQNGVSCRPFHTGKGTRQTKKIPRPRSG